MHILVDTDRLYSKKNSSKWRRSFALVIRQHGLALQQIMHVQYICLCTQRIRYKIASSLLTNKQVGVSDETIEILILFMTSHIRPAHAYATVLFESTGRILDMKQHGISTVNSIAKFTCLFTNFYL